MCGIYFRGSFSVFYAWGLSGTPCLHICSASQGNLENLLRCTNQFESANFSHVKMPTAGYTMWTMTRE